MKSTSRGSRTTRPRERGGGRVSSESGRFESANEAFFVHSPRGGLVGNAKPRDNARHIAVPPSRPASNTSTQAQRPRHSVPHATPARLHSPARDSPHSASHAMPARPDASAPRAELHDAIRQVLQPRQCRLPGCTSPRDEPFVPSQLYRRRPSPTRPTRHPLLAARRIVDPLSSTSASSLCARSARRRRAASSSAVTT